MSDHTTPPEVPPEDLIDTAGIAKMLRINPQSVRNAYRRAVRRAGSPPVQTQEAERDAALRDAFPTPGGRLRWTKSAAARILRAFDPAAGAAGLVVALVTLLLLLVVDGCIGAPFVAERMDVKKVPTSSTASSTGSSTASTSGSSASASSAASGSGSGSGGNGGSESASSSSTTSSVSASSASSVASSSSSANSSSSSGAMCTSPCGVDADCNDPVGACEVASCDAGCCTTTNAPSGTPCDDHDPCMINDTCDGHGTCVGGPLGPATFVSDGATYPTGYPGGFCLMEADYCSSTGGIRTFTPPAGYFSGPPSPCDQNGQRAGVNYAEFFCKPCVGDCATNCP